MKELWIPALIRPSEERYTGVLKSAGGAPPFGLAVVFVLLSCLFDGLMRAISLQLNQWLVGEGLRPLTEAITLFVMSLIGVAMSSFLFFIIALIVTWGLSKILGGTGSVVQHGYLMTTWLIPLLLVGGLLRLIPFVGEMLYLCMGLYGLYLNTVTAKSTHQFTWGKAIGVAILPMAVFLCFMGVFIAILSVGGALFDLLGISSFS